MNSEKRLKDTPVCIAPWRTVSLAVSLTLLLSSAMVACGGVDTTVQETDAGGSTDGGASLQVTATEPAADSIDVARNATLTVTFSADIDPTSVSGESFRVSHGGQLISGDVTIIDNRVQFVPSVQWHLAADIEVEATPEIRSVDGGELGESFVSRFVVADGSWTAPITIANEVAGFSTSVANLDGDIVFPFASTSGDIYVVNFDADEQAFSPPTLVEALEATMNNPRADINPSGQAIVTWISAALPIQLGWSRFDGTSWGAVTQQITQTNQSSVGLADDGTAVVVGNVFEPGGDPRTEIRRLPAGAALWSASNVLQTQTQLWSIRNSEDSVQVVLDNPSGGLVSRQYDPATGTFEPPTTIDASGDANYIFHAQLTDGDMSFSWMRDDVAVYHSRFDAETKQWSSEKLGDGQGGSQVCENISGMRLGVFRTNSTLVARVAEPGAEFGMTQNLGNLTNVEYANCFLDDSGNGHAFFGGYGDEPTTWSRYSPGAGWSTPVSLEMPSGFVRGIHTDRFGNISILYADGSDMSLRRFQ